MEINKCNLSELVQSVTVDSVKMTDILKFIERCAFYAGIDDSLKLDCANFCRLRSSFTIYIPFKSPVELDALADFKENLMTEYPIVYLYVYNDGELEVNLS